MASEISATLSILKLFHVEWGIGFTLGLLAILAGGAPAFKAFGHADQPEDDAENGQQHYATGGVEAGAVAFGAGNVAIRSDIAP